MEDFERRVTSIAALAEPVRRALYRFVVRQAAPVSRDEAAEGVGVPRHVAKFNLDKLAEDGLLETEFSRPPGRSGPGAGRPAKRYRRADREIALSLPERRYDLAGHVMAAALEAATGTGAPAGDALQEAARRTGRDAGAAARTGLGTRPSSARLRERLAEVLADHGYEPRTSSSGLALDNCPFHALAEEHRALVCGMNRDLVAGVLEGLGADRLRAELDPAPGRCCVTVR